MDLIAVRLFVEPGQSTPGTSVRTSSARGHLPFSPRGDHNSIQQQSRPCPRTNESLRRTILSTEVGTSTAAMGVAEKSQDAGAILAPC
jgi:hypothetical protein